MTSLVFAISELFPKLFPSDQLVVDQLKRQAINVQVIPWTKDLPSFCKADLVVVRETWDYHTRVEDFKLWLTRLEDASVAVQNPLPLMRWNLDKSYLLELSQRGVRIPRTQVFDADGPDPDAEAFADLQTVITKPIVGAGNQKVQRIPQAELQSWLRSPARRDSPRWMLQEYLPSIEDPGEVSLIYIGKEYSHAVIKQPAAGDFRVNEEFQGTTRVYQPNSEDLNWAQSILGLLPYPSLYARIDYVQSGEERVLLELELIEPELYHKHCPEAVPMFADALIACLNAN